MDEERMIEEDERMAAMAEFYVVDALERLTADVDKASASSRLTVLSETLHSTQHAEGLAASIGSQDWERLVRAMCSGGSATVTVQVEVEAEAEAEEERTDDSEERRVVAVAVPYAAEEAPGISLGLLDGVDRTYLYSKRAMTDAYANWSFLAEEGDDLVTFVSCVREESRLYPRPLPIESLQNAPFRMSAERIEALYERATATTGMADIHRCVASNGDVYYYSTDHLSERRACSLAERRSVLIPENP